MKFQENAQKIRLMKLTVAKLCKFVTNAAKFDPYVKQVLLESFKQWQQNQKSNNYDRNCCDSVTQIDSQVRLGGKITGFPLNTLRTSCKLARLTGVVKQRFN